MSVASDKANKASSEAAEALGDPVDFSQLPGFHVMRKDNGIHVGTYGTREDAEMFVAGHLTPQEVEAEIVEGTAL